MIEVLFVFSSLIYMIVLSSVFVSIRAVKEIWPLLFVFEYALFIGLAVTPLMLIFGFSSNQNYDLSSFSLLTPLHILLYSVGALFGFFGVGKKRIRIAGENLFIKVVGLNPLQPSRLFFGLLGVSIFSSILYIAVVGIELVFISASSARGGNFELIEEFMQYRVLNRLSLLGLFGAAFMPYFLEREIHIKTSLFLLSIASLLFYLISVSRFSLMMGIILPGIWFWLYYGRRSLISNILFIFIVLLGVFVAIYGKAFVGYIASSFFVGNDVSLLSDEEDIGDLLSRFFMGFTHFLFSVDVGIKSFFANGVQLFPDVYLSVFGVMPSSWMSSIGLEDLSYQFLGANDRFACVNTYNITGESGCFLPPYFSGASAYTLPLVGGFVFGFVRFYLYRVALQLIRSRRVETKVYTLFILLLIDFSTSFIPNSISIAVFLMLVVFLIRVLRDLLPRRF